MHGRIIHYGQDDFSRLPALRHAGYSVERCDSLSELRWALYFGLRADLVLFSEAPGPLPARAITLARCRHTPVVLFQGDSPHYDESEFDLVIPIATSCGLWLADVACLLQRTHNLLQWSAASPSHPVLQQRVCHEGDAAIFELSSDVVYPPVLPLRTRPTPGSSPLTFVPRENSFLASLDEEAMKDFFSLLKFSTSAPGAVLFFEDQPPRDVIFLLSGQVKLSLNSSDGRRFIAHIAGPGEILGLAAAFASTSHQATAEAAYHCELASLPCAAFLAFLDQYPAAFRVAARELSRDYNHACARLRTMGVSVTVVKKMAGLLLEWATTGNRTDRGTQIHLALTHVEIGQCIGTTRESVTRVLHDLQRRRIIDHKGSLLTILDRTALESCASVH